MNVATDLVGESVEYKLSGTVEHAEGHGVIRAVGYDQSSDQHQGFIFMILTTEGKLIRAPMEQVTLVNKGSAAKKVGEALGAAT